MTISIYLKKTDEWAFGHIAFDLAKRLGIEVTENLKGLCYLLSEPNDMRGCRSYIPIDAIKMASDKRLIEEAFINNDVNRPQTWIFHNQDAVNNLLETNPGKRFIIKYPTSCGSNGHYIVNNKMFEKKNWPLPYLVQEFIELDIPKVFRVYFVNGVYIGSNVRKFPDGVRNDLVAHAKGARYYYDETVDDLGINESLKALQATNLLTSFGVVDLIKHNGTWMVLEVGTDGIYNHVDRDFNNDNLLNALHDAISNDLKNKQ